MVFTIFMTGPEDDPEAWLNFLVRRLKMALRLAKDSRSIAILRELVGEVEKRSAQLAEWREADRQEARKAGDC